MIPPVVLIEDNEMISRAIPMLLRREGLEVERRDSELPPYDKEQWGQVQVVLCDLALPRRDGVELGLELRERGYRGPIVFITGLCDAELGPFQSRLSPCSLLQKPFGQGELLQVVARALEAR